MALQGIIAGVRAVTSFTVKPYTHPPHLLIKVIRKYMTFGVADVPSDVIFIQKTPTRTPRPEAFHFGVFALTTTTVILNVFMVLTEVFSDGLTSGFDQRRTLHGGVAPSAAYQVFGGGSLARAHLGMSMIA